MALYSDDERRGFPKAAPAEDKDEAARKATLVTAIIDRFTLVSTAETRQRAREIDDLKFDRALAEDQWPAEILKARAASVAPDGTVIAERPSLVINKLDQPVQQVTNEARQARLGIEVKPKSEKASKAGATLRQGMIRAIEVDSNAQQARMWALERAVKCGRGYYRILTDYANDGDFDLDIRIGRILNQGCVYFDPYATEKDLSDAEWVILTETISKDEYTRRWPDSKLTGILEAGGGELTTVTDQAPGWIDDDDVRIAESYYVEREKRTLILDPLTGETRLLEAGEVAPADPMTGRPPKSRQVDVRRVKWCVTNCAEVLQEQDWPGRYLPIVAVDGKEYVVDGRERCWKGMVSNAKDAQRSYNYMRSAQVEMTALASKAPWILDPLQIEGYEDFWKQANTVNLPYLPAHQYIGGVQYSPPIRNVWEPAIQAVTMLTREAEADIKATTGRFDPSLGQMSGERSGRAIKELKQQGENSSSHYLENLAGVSMVHEGRILLDLLPKVYDRPGRIVKLLGDDPRDEKQVMLGVPFVPGPEGQPVRAEEAPRPPGMMQAAAARVMGFMRGQPGPQAPPMPPSPPPTVYTLDDGGEYMCQVTVGRAFATQREANLNAITTVIEATKGAAAPLLMDLYAELLEGNIGSRMAERFRKANPQLNDEGEGPAIPPEVQAQMQAAQQQVQQLTAAVQQLQQQLETESYKVDAQVAMKQAELAADREIALEKVRADLAKTKATLDSKEAIALLEAEEARLASAVEHAQGEALERLKAVQKQREIVLQTLLKAMTPTTTGPSRGEAVTTSTPLKPLPFEAPGAAVAVGPSGAVSDPRLV